MDASIANNRIGLELSNSSEPLFRALTVDGKRRALRLEKVYWDALDLIAKETSLSVPDLIRFVDNSHLRDSNLASAMRIFALQWMRDRSSDLGDVLSQTATFNLVSALPAPAFVLGSDRQLKHNNAAFQRFVRTGFSTLSATGSPSNLRLQIDMNMSDLMAALEENGNRAIELGFVIGFDERRLRGRINAIRAQCFPENLLIGLVLA